MATPNKSKKRTIEVSSKLAAKERQEALRRQQQQTRVILLGIIAVVVLVGVIVIVLVSSQPAEAQVSDDAKTHYNELEKLGYMGITEEGFPYLGKADAPVVVEEYSSFACPFCLKYHTEEINNVFDKFKAGDLKYIYIPVTFIDYDNTTATRAALCAAQQSPAKFWAFHDVLFDWQTLYGQSTNDVAKLNAAAGKLGLDTGKFSSCLSGDGGKDVIAKGAKKWDDNKLNGTPTVFIDGQLAKGAGGGSPNLSELRGIIETKIAAKKASSAPAQQSTAAATSAATAAATSAPTAAATAAAAQ